MTRPEIVGAVVIAVVGIEALVAFIIGLVHGYREPGIRLSRERAEWRRAAERIRRRGDRNGNGGAA